MSVALGYSGIAGSAEILVGRSDLTAPEQRIFQGMDAAAALVVDGRVVAAVQEERFSGVKSDHRFPVESIRWCLEHAGITEDDVDVVAHGFSFGPYERLFTSTEARHRYRSVLAPERQAALLTEHLPALGHRLRVRGVRHHHAHALSAAAAAPFDECLAVVMDGMGESDAISVFRFDGELHPLSVQDYRSSLGLFYSLVTLHLGYLPNSDEYRVMALAAFGDRSRYREVLARAVRLLPRGRIRIPLLESLPDDRYREQYRAGRRWLAERTFAPSKERADPPREHADLAAAAQERLEDAIVHVVSHWITETGIRNIAYAGGVALNSVANRRLLDRGATGLYVQPGAGDEGTALGAAYAAGGFDRARSFPALPLLGPSVDTPQGPGWTPLGCVDAAVQLAAALLQRGAVVGWANGRLEFGPRALGARSILADPRDAATRDRVNATVKFREPYRPLAPAVLAEHAAQWFQIPSGAETRHMTVVVPVKPDRRHLVPAITHVDGTARVQVVHRSEHPTFWSLLEAFRRRTGVPLLLNTSLNVKGQPIARTADDALRTFQGSSLDALFVNDHVVARDPWQPVGAFSR
jgi:carbamoyltransferase